MYIDSLTSLFAQELVAIRLGIIQMQSSVQQLAATLQLITAAVASW